MKRGRKPKPEGTIRTKTNGNIQQKIGNKWVYIGCDSELKKKANAKFQKEPWEPNFPPVTLPDHIRPTNYPHYYVSNDGIAYREPRRCDENGRYGEVNEWGLIQLTTHLRGNPNCGDEKKYESVNIYFYDEDGKNIGYKKRNIHQLVAETFVPNPHGYTEILHMDENNKNNHYTNLKWGTHKENLQVKAYPEGTIVEHPRYGGRASTKYIKKNGEWVLIPSNRPPWNKGKKYKMPEGHQAWNKGKRWKKSKQLPEGTVKIRKSGAKYKKIDGNWVYQGREKMEGEPRYKVDRVHKSKPDGTITTRADGTKWKKENGKWVYQKKKDYIKYGV